MAKILIVEDQKFLAGMFKIFLSEYEVVVAHTGREGLALFETEAPNVVVTDIELPDMSGFDVLRAMQATRSTPVIVLTAGEDYAALATESGAALALKKPMSKSTLLAAIETVLSEDR